MALIHNMLLWVIAVFAVNFIAQFLSFVITRLIKKESLKDLGW